MFWGRDRAGRATLDGNRKYRVFKKEWCGFKKKLLNDY
jgi:hypothetical protein